MEAYWNTLSAEQVTALKLRKMADLKSLSQVQVEKGMFADIKNARYLRTGAMPAWMTRPRPRSISTP